MVEGRWEEFGATIDPASFRRSTVERIDRLAAEHPAQTVAVVCHGAVINAYLGRGHRHPPALVVRAPLHVDPPGARVSRGGVRSVETVNETAHLRVPD